MGTARLRAPWWIEEVHGRAWRQVREAVERDWENIREELGITSHELVETTPRWLGTVPITGEWEQAEDPIGFGYGARQQFGEEHPDWSPELAATLSHDWTIAGQHAFDWSAAAPLVRRGYEYDRNDVKTWPGTRARTSTG